MGKEPSAWWRRSQTTDALHIGWNPKLDIREAFERLPSVVPLLKNLVLSYRVVEDDVAKSYPSLLGRR